MNAELMPEAAAVPEGYRLDDLLIDVQLRQVTRAGCDLGIAGLSFDLLVLLVRAAPKLVSTDALMEGVWSGVIVGPETVKQRVKLLRQALGDSADRPRYIVVVRGHGYRMPTAAVPLVAVSRLRLDVTAPSQSAAQCPDLSSAELPAAASAPASLLGLPTRGGLLLLAVLVAVGAGGLWWGIEHARNPQLQTPLQASPPPLEPHVPAAVARAPAGSIAVIPFANLTGDPSKVYLSDGIAEELIHALAQEPGLKVPARTSSFAYKGRNIDARRIAQDLGVSTVLEGSVQSAGARIRITAQLVDAQSGYQISSQSYDRQSGDIFELEDELAGAIVQAFRTSLKVDLPASTPRRPPTQDLDAYRLYLQAESIPNGSPQSFLAGLALDDEALRHDPKFARALEGRAFMRTALLWQGYPLPRGIEDAQQDAEQALALDPSLAEAHAVLGTLNALRNDWPQAESDFRAAIAADPTDGVMRVQYAAAVLLATGQLRKAHVEAVEGHRLAPGNPFTAAMLALVDQAMGSDQDAVKFSDMAIAQGASPSERETIYTVAAARRGDYGAAASHAVKALPAAVLTRGGAEAVRLAYVALAEPTQQPAALQALDGLTRDAAWKNVDSQRRQFVLYLYARFGVLDKLYEQLNKLLPDGGTTHPEIVAIGSLWLPEMRAFRRDPRFQALATRLRLVEYWRRYWPPDDCELNDEKLTCH